jgi:putative transposase
MSKTKNLSHVGKLLDLQDLQVQPFVNGLIKAMLKVTKLHLVNDSIVLNACRILLVAFLLVKKSQRSFIVELAHLNKKTILIDKSNNLNISILPMKLFLIVVQGLTLKEKDYKPFWNGQFKELSEKLWLPTEIGYQDSLSISSNGLSNKEMVKSSYWMKKFTNPQNRNLQKICCPSFTSTHVDKWVGEDIKLKTLKIQLKTSLEQRQILQDWMNTTRYVYNKTVDLIQNQNQKINFYDLRNKLVTAKNNTLTDWELKTPKDVRAGAVKEVVDAYTTAFTNLRRNNISKFNIGFRSKKKHSDTLTIPKSSIKAYGSEFVIYPRFIKEPIKFNLRSFYWEDIHHDTKIVKQNSKFYILIPVPCIKKHKKTNNVIAGDLGNRTFLTTYDSVNVIEFNRNKELLKKLTNKIDSMKSARKRKHKISKVESKIKNIVSDLHWKTAVYLIDNYDTIFMGILESQKCVQKSKNRKLNRDMNILSHYKFLEKLRYLCNTKHRNLVMVNEAFTSQTCPNCGCLSKTTEKLWHCSTCYLSIDRDILGARNILMKGMLSGVRPCSFKVLNGLS